MTRKKATDYSPAVLRLFDQFVHGDISRRDFLDRAASVAIGGIGAAALLESLVPDFAAGQRIDVDDDRLESRYVEFESPEGAGTMRGYLITPAGATEPLPGVVVIHENRGLNPHIEDIARRVALEGFAAFAPDALTPLGGYPGDEDRARELFAQLDRDRLVEDFAAAVTWLGEAEECNGRVGAVGFCFGGGMVNQLAVRLLELAAGVAFYGGQAPLDQATSIRSPLMLHYAETDERINAGWPPYQSALDDAGVEYQVFFYPGTNHGFNNDTTPRFDAEAAALAWQRTIDFFKQHLG